MSILFGLIGGVPHWDDIEGPYPALRILEARKFDGGLRIWIDETHSFVVKEDLICLECTRKSKQPVNRIFIGWRASFGWAVRGKCPRCGAETATMYKGWKPERPPMGGMQKRRFRKRRQVANY